MRMIRLGGHLGDSAGKMPKVAAKGMVNAIAVRVLR